jgi:hypothetical protein
MSKKKFIHFLSNIKSLDYFKNNNLFKYKSLETYLNIYYGCIEKDKVFTDTKICFSPDVNFGSSIKEVKKKNPNECTFVENTKECKILIYKIKVGGHKFKLEMHFFKNKLVFFNYILRTSEGKKAILNLITKKYLGSEDNISLDFSKNTLTDGLRNYIEVDNSVLLSVRYFTFKFGFFDYLKKMQSYYQVQKLKGHDSEESALFKTI